MNILPHKSWHVRTKKNIHRVRRDELRASEEEKRQLERQLQAENERRMNLLRNRADDRVAEMFGTTSTAKKDVTISDETGHVNLFQDLEREERKNLGSGNREYEEEKAKEKREWESKMGIQVYFADNTNDLNKKKEWYEEMPMRKRRQSEEESKKLVKKREDFLSERAKKEVEFRTKMEEERRRNRKDSSSSEEEIKEKKRKKDSSKKKKRKRKDSSSSSEDDDSEKEKKKKKKKKKKKNKEVEEEYEIAKKRRLEELRDERIRRERQESARQHVLLHPEKAKKSVEKKPKYNSQFNPDFARK